MLKVKRILPMMPPCLTITASSSLVVCVILGAFNIQNSLPWHISSTFSGFDVILLDVIAGAIRLPIFIKGSPNKSYSVAGRLVILPV